MSPDRFRRNPFTGRVDNAAALQGLLVLVRGAVITLSESDDPVGEELRLRPRQRPCAANRYRS